MGVGCTLIQFKVYAAPQKKSHIPELPVEKFLTNHF